MSDGHVAVGTGASRRMVFLGAGAVGATAVLAACGTEEPSGDPGAAPQTTGSEPDPTATTPGDGGDSGEDGNGAEEEEAALVTAGEVEVGGGVIIDGASVVVTQPAEGTFMGFSAVCTHQGCIVSSISDGTINCGCHGSQYSIEDGSVVRAATGLTPETQEPLPAVDLSVDGDRITRA